MLYMEPMVAAVELYGVTKSSSLGHVLRPRANISWNLVSDVMLMDPCSLKLPIPAGPGFSLHVARVPNQSTLLPISRVEHIGV
jgi:hypothetical protein